MQCVVFFHSSLITNFFSFLNSTSYWKTKNISFSKIQRQQLLPNIVIRTMLGLSNLEIGQTSATLFPKHISHSPKFSVMAY